MISYIIISYITGLFLLSEKNTLNSITLGSTQPALSISSLKEANISLPPISEQKAIASVLSSIDDNIDLLHCQNNTLESIAETIFRQWFIEETDDSLEEGVLGDSYLIERECRYLKFNETKKKMEIISHIMAQQQ